ncbi:hypothetical protein VKT23_017009, partial [Stygiomarasmius scandens]
IIVESTSGYKYSGSHVTDSNTAVSVKDDVHIGNPNCTFNLEDGTGVCVEEFSGETGTITFTGVVLPIITIGVDSSDAIGIGISAWTWIVALLFTMTAWVLIS